uniref:NIDO domain-containing protein n=1 Tax=Pavo cristatus TaxID=9049 RepID=A0A8C9FKA9_PAVCR
MDDAIFTFFFPQGNTFQATLTTSTDTSFVILNYKDIQWTTGVASGGDPKTGLGGTPAHAGFNSGDETNYYNIPGSRTEAVINITKTSNVNVPGRWVFQVDDFKVTGVTTEAPNAAADKRSVNASQTPLTPSLWPLLQTRSTTSARAIKLQLRRRGSRVPSVSQLSVCTEGCLGFICTNFCPFTP